MGLESFDNISHPFMLELLGVFHKNSPLEFQVTRTQLFVMTMNSSTTNPYLPCNVEQDNLDFDAIVRDIVAEQEAVKRHIGTSVTSALSVSG